jgi:DNA-binding NarL/FixJ family response regulator
MDSDASVAVSRDSAEFHRTRVVLLDGQRLFRQALSALLAGQGDYAVVGESGRADEALELIGTVQPAIVITELQFSGGSGLELIGQIHGRYPKVAILVLTTVRAREAAATIRRAGALGYLLKDCAGTELRAALQDVACGRWHRSRAIATRARCAPFTDPNVSARAAYLTERQRLILRSVARGHRTREIAQMLGVSVRAVHQQRERLRTTLQLNSTAELTRFAVSEGFAEESAPAR